MRFAIALTDRYLGVFQVLIERGWTPLRVYTSEVDQRLHHNAAVLEYAQRLKVDVQISRLSDRNLGELGAQACEVLVVASYRWRIGEWRPHLKYAVNFHPSPLPQGRGPAPLPGAILEGARQWGVSCHRLERDFDSGPVLKVEEFPLSPDEDYDSLDLKAQLAARRLATVVTARFEDCWNAAVPQVGGSYHSLWSAEDRRLDFSRPVEEVLRKLRAFGPLECLAHINNMTLFVRRAVGWTEAHALPPGSVVHVNNLAMVVVAADGFIGLTEWSLIEANTVTGTPRR